MNTAQSLRVTDKSESALRFEVRNAWREEGNLETYKRYPSHSLERSICISEAQRIRFEQDFNHEPY